MRRANLMVCVSVLRKFSRTSDQQQLQYVYHRSPDWQQRYAGLMPSRLFSSLQMLAAGERFSASQ
jgi:hypothetical protein